MSIDMSQFHQVFFEESFEGLDSMETGLLELGQGGEDPDLINSIFRAAHSIKGGSGTFGFTAVANFTHVMETLLDEMRDGKREVTTDGVNLLLASVDVVRDMLTAVRDGSSLDEERVGSTQAGLEAMLDSTEEATGTEEGQAKIAPAAGWQIVFKPLPHLMQTGNDPARMFRELAQLGDLETEVDLTELPPLEDLTPEECYLSWKLSLHGEATREQVEEIFEWVDGDCELNINPLQPGSAKNEDTPEIQDEVPEKTKNTQAVSDPAASKNSTTTQKSPARAKSGGDSGSIRVGIEKVDALINMVGELVITQSMLSQIGEDVEEFDQASFERLRDGLQDLERNTRELQESVMRIRMLPISFSFNRFPRLVHDLSSKLGKKVELKLSGEGTELDKTVLEKIGDPLVHLVRNSMDHGIETPDQRVAKGKSETGILHLNAYHQGGNIVIEIEDDGAGFNREKITAKARERGVIGENETLSDEEIDQLIFEPGFSTADEISDVSGRGVGMDVVRRNIIDLGGTVEVTSRPGEGTTFTIRLPLTLAILDGQLVRVGNETYVVPLVSIVESLQIRDEQINTVSGRAQVYKLRDDYIPIINMHDAFSIQERHGEYADGLLVVVEGNGQKAGFVVDDLLGQQQVVIKSLETNYKRVKGVSGATILGDGTVALIVDVAGLIRLSRKKSNSTLRSVA